MNVLTKWIIGLFAVILVIILLFMGYKSFYNELFLSQSCWEEINAKKINLKGIIQNKFIDSSNHAYPSIRVINNANTVIFAITDVEATLLWKKIEPGDSIIKNENDLKYLLIHKEHRRDTIIIRYNCRK